MEFFFKEKKGAHSSETRKFLYSRPAGMAVSIDWHGIGFGCGERVFQRVWRVVRVVGRGWAGVCVCCSCHDRWPVGWRGVLIFFVCVFIIYHHHLARLFTFAGWRVGVVPSIFFCFFYQRVVRDQISVSGFFFSSSLSVERKKERKKERKNGEQTAAAVARPPGAAIVLETSPPPPTPTPCHLGRFFFFFLFFCLFRCVCVCVPFICQSVLFFPAEVARITFSVGNLHKIICESNGK